MKEKLKIIIIHETIWESITRDMVTFSGVFGLIMLGVLLDSVPMQWVGAVLAMLGIFARSLELVKGESGHLNIAGARKRLDELEKQFADK